METSLENLYVNIGTWRVNNKLIFKGIAIISYVEFTML